MSFAFLSYVLDILSDSVALLLYLFRLDLAMPVAVSSTSTAKLTANPKIVFPDLITACPFPLRMNPQCKQAASTSEAWLMRGGNMSEKKRKAYHGLKAGLLTSMCYPEAQYTELRVCCDYINYLFHLDNISDCMDERGTNRTAEVVMGVLRSPKKYKTSTRIGRMTRECVFLDTFLSFGLSIHSTFDTHTL